MPFKKSPLLGREPCCVNEAMCPGLNSTFTRRQAYGLTSASLKTVIKTDPQPTVSILLTVHERWVSVFNPSASSSTQSHMITPRVHPSCFPPHRGCPVLLLIKKKCYGAFVAGVPRLGIAPAPKACWFASRLQRMPGCGLDLW